jgi:prepilin-type N-terminal cleavage/methylation domain-containing protein
MKNRIKAFTLVELLVVIGIISLLISMKQVGQRFRLAWVELLEVSYCQILWMASEPLSGLSDTVYERNSIKYVG